MWGKHLGPQFTIWKDTCVRDLVHRRGSSSIYSLVNNFLATQLLRDCSSSEPWTMTCVQISQILDIIDVILQGLKLFIHFHVDAVCVHAKLLQSCPTLCDPHGLYLARLFCPWDSPGESTGVDCHALLQGIFPILRSYLNLLCLCIGRQVLCR